MLSFAWAGFAFVFHPVRSQGSRRRKHRDKDDSKNSFHKLAWFQPVIAQGETIWKGRLFEEPEDVSAWKLCPGRYGIPVWHFSGALAVLDIRVRYEDHSTH